MFTQRHYVAIAKALSDDKDQTQYCDTANEKIFRVFQIAKTTRRLADLFQSDNARFNRAKFYKAVGIGL